MKRGAEQQLTRDSTDDVEVCPEQVYAQPHANFHVGYQEVAETGPGRGVQKADESVLASRPYVYLRYHTLSVFTFIIECVRYPNALHSLLHLHHP